MQKRKTRVRRFIASIVGVCGMVGVASLSWQPFSSWKLSIYLLGIGFSAYYLFDGYKKATGTSTT